MVLPKKICIIIGYQWPVASEHCLILNTLHGLVSRSDKVDHLPAPFSSGLLLLPQPPTVPDRNQTLKHLFWSHLSLVLVCLNLAYLWNTASLCSQKTLPRRFHLSDAGLFLITTNFIAPANQHQLSLLLLTLKPEPHDWSFQVLLAKPGTWPPCSITLSSAFCFPTPSLPKLGYPGTCSVDWLWTQRSACLSPKHWD